MELFTDRRDKKILNLCSDIVDNTVLNKTKSNISSSNQSSAFTSYSGKPGPSILRNSEYKSQPSATTDVNNLQRYVKIHSPRSTNESMVSVAHSVKSNPIGQFDYMTNVRPVPIGQAAVSSHETMKSRSHDFPSFSGFDSVREALLKTSSAITDIDKLLERK